MKNDILSERPCTVHSGPAPRHNSKLFVTPNGAVKHERLGYSAIDYTERIFHKKLYLK